MYDLADRIDARLPQTQCTKCGFNGCRPYAEAIAAGEVGIDRCPPGGEAGVATLAALLGRPIVPLDLSRGHPGPLRVARIDEQHCIGCTLCIQACPVDAIVGANKRMHTILPSACTGCDLCVAPCPVDCIHMEPVVPARAWTDLDAADARRRYTLRNARLTRDHDRGHPPFERAAEPAPDSAPTAVHDALDATAASTSSAASTNSSSPASRVASNAASDATATADPNVAATSPVATGLATTPSPDTAADRKQAILAAALARARARRAT